ncbi:MAG: hypothetical protein L6Q98_22740 [Anaerolineae bacterium]|nr:hypothetical protein [Anaerolineae bacterium]NUQ05207.1 hypothetical protein [Anaerolineae bacterium]
MTNQTLLPALEALSDARDRASDYLTQAQGDIEQTYQDGLNTLQRDHDERIHAAQDQFVQDETAAQSRITTVLERLKYTAAPWTAAGWEGYPAEMSPNALNGSLRAGTLPQAFPQFGIEKMPMLIPLLDVGHIIIASQGAAKVKARAIFRSLIARAVLQLAGAGARFHFIDPIAVGANFPFQSLPTSVRGERVIVEADEIDATMKTFTDAIRDGGLNAPLVLCAADFPVRWSSDALMRLETVASAGVAKQVYTILQIDMGRAQQDQIDLDSLMSASSLITVSDDNVTAKVQGTTYTFDPDEQPPAPLLNTLLTALVSTLTT